MRICRMFKWQSTCSVALLLFASVACAQRTADKVAQASASSAVSPAHDADSTLLARRFVQQFYDWYLSFAAAEQLRHPPYWDVLNNRSNYLDERLANALRADSVARDG